MSLFMKQTKINNHENNNNGKENTEENSLSLIATKKGKEEYIECSQQVNLSSEFRGVGNLSSF